MKKGAKRGRKKGLILKSSIKKTSTEQSSQSEQAVKSVKCTMCPFVARAKSLLKAHFDAVHLNLRPWKCELCSYAGGSKGESYYNCMDK